MPADTAVPLALVANELVTNAMKHAFPSHRGAVSVAFRADPGGGCRLVVADTGRGLPAAAPPDGGLGLRLVRALVAQVDGDLAMESGPGLRVTVTVPPKDGGHE
jgi:two-component sensor histidine kinase